MAKSEYAVGDKVAVKEAVTGGETIVGTLAGIPTANDPYWIIIDVDGNPHYFGAHMHICDPKSFTPQP